MGTPGEDEAARPALELRVHGVSGTPPEALLDRPLVEQIAGDRIAGFFAPRLESEQTDAAPQPFAPEREGAARLVGYSWGGITSGSAGRALWLPLLPFTLINIAPRARPAGAGAAQTWLIWYLCRLLALLMTCLLVLTAAGIGDDLMGWQCAHTNTCQDATPTKLFKHVFLMHQLSDEHMLLLGSLVPLLLLSLLWLVSARTWNRYERTIVKAPKALAGAKDPERNATEIGLDSPLMWSNAAQVRRLRATHMQTGFALIIWTLVAPTERPWGFSDGDPSGLLARLWLAVHTHLPSLGAAAIMLYGCVVLAVPSYVGRDDSKAWKRASRCIWLALGVLGGWEIYGLGFAKGWIHPGYVIKVTGEPRGGGLPYFAATVFVDFAAAMAVLILLLVVVAVARFKPIAAPQLPQQPMRPGMWGLTTGAFATLGALFGASFAAGLYTFAGAWLTTGSVKPGFSEVSHIYSKFVVPDAVRAANHAFLIGAVFLALLLVFVGAVLGVGLGFAASRSGIAVPVLGLFAVVLALDIVAAVQGSTPWTVVCTILAVGALVVAVGARSTSLVDPKAIGTDYPTSDDGHDRGRTKTIWRAIYLARLVDCAPLIVAPLALVGLVVACVYGGQLMLDRPHAETQTAGQHNVFSLDSLTAAGVGAYLTVLSILGLVALGVVAFRTPTLRRSVGILWDVASVWPRTSHPLAAPCYAERTGPDIVTFLSNARATEPGTAIVLAAHSQGTVISAAVIAQLDAFDKHVDADERVLPKLGFLSFGCVLRRLYGRYFPVYFGPAELTALQTRLGGKPPRWRNLWRYTDYLGGQVTCGPPPRVPAPPSPVPPHWEWHRPDPPSFDRPDGDTSYSAPHRHSDFWADESGYFQDAVVDLAKQIHRGAPGP
ncbi:MAG: hypothetical protein QOJ34_2348 [Pseudonocardiales bacterium]|nr:hypothetical protein [Pseudonocardiales bacterium]